MAPEDGQEGRKRRRPRRRIHLTCTGCLVICGMLVVLLLIGVGIGLHFFSRPLPVAPARAFLVPQTRAFGLVRIRAEDEHFVALLREAVLAAGGRIAVELHEYPGGRRFTFADPFGNILGVYQPLE